MTKEKLTAALARFLERLAADKHVLAAVQVGSFADEVLWRKDTIHLWIIEEDGVTRRLKSDGEDERIFRTLVEDDVNVHAELIPRSRFKLMVEGSSRTAFSCSFFAKRQLVHCTDPSISQWFAAAQAVAVKDQKREVLAAASWVMHSAHHARKIVAAGKPEALLHETLLWAAHGVAAVHVIERGQIVEDDMLARAAAFEPELFRVIHGDVLAKPLDRSTLLLALERVEAALETDGERWAAPLLGFLLKQGRVVPFSEIADHFAATQLYPGHLESACEWLTRKGTVQKLSAPFRLTRKSRVEIEEPAYLVED